MSFDYTGPRLCDAGFFCPCGNSTRSLYGAAIKAHRQKSLARVGLTNARWSESAPALTQRLGRAGDANFDSVFSSAHSAVYGSTPIISIYASIDELLQVCSFAYYWLDYHRGMKLLTFGTCRSCR